MKRQTHQVTGSVEVIEYQTNSIASADESGISLIETRLLEKFTGGLFGTGLGDHVAVVGANGNTTFTGGENVHGTPHVSSRSFAPTPPGSTKLHIVAHSTM